MAGLIREDDISAVRDRTDILAVMAEYGVQVKRAGTSYKALCPFHDEHSPSMSIRPSANFFHCFGCGEGGDVIDFVRKIDHLDFLEAVERLAERAGLELRREDDGTAAAPEPSGPRRSRILEINQLAEAWFADRLATAPEAVIARGFLKSRTFTRAHADLFTLGYAPRGWDNLSTYLTSQTIPAEDIIGAGLASLSKHGTPVDRFRGRLIWPIHDVTGSTIGFGARKLHEDDDGPKYLNTPETRAYKKSQVLYGLDLARKDIATTGHAVIVEGYTDVMAAQIAGVTTAVATCGTAFGEDHTKILRRVLGDGAGTETTFLFDGDSAGQKAALRAYELEAKMQSTTSVVIVPDGLDPCELRIREGDQALRNLIATRTPLFEFVIKAAITGQDLTSPSGRTTAMALTAPVLARIKDGFLRGEYVRTMAARLGVAETSLREGVIQASRTMSAPARADRPVPAVPVETVPAIVSIDDMAGDQNPPEPHLHDLNPDPSPPVSEPASAPTSAPPAVRPDYPRPNPADPHLWFEREISKIALQQPDLLNDHLGSLTGADFTQPAYRDVVRLARLARTNSASDTHWISFIRDHATDATTASLIHELSVDPLGVETPSPEWAKTIVLRLRLTCLARDCAAIQTELRQADGGAAVNDLMARGVTAGRELRAVEAQLLAANQWAGQ
ncbi:DNA primase [Tessaracoccus sp.]